jgi:hypothetical protein
METRRKCIAERADHHKTEIAERPGSASTDNVERDFTDFSQKFGVR